MKKKIMLTTDLSESAESAFPVAKEQLDLWGRENSELSIVTIVENLAQVLPVYGYGFAYSNIDFEKVREDLVKAADEKLSDLISHYFSEYNVKKCILEHDEPVYSKIVHFAKENKMELIILATHGRSGFRRFMLGSIAESVIREADIPVLCIKGREDEE